MRALCFGVLIAGSGLGLGLACGPPSSFDHLVGGTAAKPDAGEDSVADAEVEAAPADASDSTLPAPRPTSPLSATWVNGSRPHFAWRLGPTLIGARIELSTSPLFDPQHVQTYDAESDFDPPADLAPGFWFWRLRGRTATAVGTEDKASPVWEVLVRGGGGSTHANGTMVDIDGDGRPDIVTAIKYGNPAFGPPSQIVGLFSTTADSSAFETPYVTTLGEPVLRAGPASTSENPRVVVNDANGDGHSDVTIAEIDTGNVAVATFNGTTVGISTAKGTTVQLPPVSTLPLLGESMDLDGDGYADMVLSTDDATYIAYGSAQGFGTLAQLVNTAPIDPDGGFPADAGPLPFEARYDRNADGLSDIALSWPIGPGIIAVYQGASNRDTIDRSEFLGVASPAPPPPSRLVGGDVDGDGKNDLAFVTTIASQPAICVIAGTALRSAPYPCWSPASVPAGFASAMTTVDLEPDGRDEVLVGSSSGGVDILRLVADPDGGVPSLVAEHVTTDFGATLTTVHPGRPTAGIWVAGRQDGSALQVFKGKTPGQLLPAVAPTSFSLTLR